MTSEIPSCPICGENLSLSLARGRKSGKPFIMLRCPVDGRHLRGFITDRPFVTAMLDKLETLKQANTEEAK